MTATLYRYSARTRSGNAVAGTMLASSEGDALTRLRGRRLLITSLEDAATVRGRVAGIMRRHSSRKSAQTDALRTLSTLVSSGTSLIRALGVAAEQCRDKQFAETLRAIRADVTGGVALSEAVGRRPLEFPQSVVAMIRAGEVGGILDEVLQRSAAILAHRDALRRQLGSLLAYPLFVLGAATLLMLFLIIVTLPGFASILTQLHASLPLSTRLLLAMSGALRNPGIWLMMAVVGTVIALGAASLARTSYGSSLIDMLSLNISVVGALRRQANIAAFARTTGTLLQCGVGLNASVEAAADVVTSVTYRNAAHDAIRLLSDGEPLSGVLDRSGLFGGLCVQMASVGEESGALDVALIRVAEHYESELSVSLRGLTSVIEPALILVLGVFVGSVVASILVPLYAAVGSIH